jgi:predicted Zn-dependent peptidase
VGSRDEKWPKEAGLAHFFEHAVFQGNRKFRTAKTLTSHLEDAGGMINAWTCKEMTFYWSVTLGGEFFERSVAALFHMFDSPLFEEMDLAVEKKQVIEEIAMITDDDEENILDVFDNFAYGSHPLGRNVLSTSSTVTSFNKKILTTFAKTFYHPNNYQFLAVGNVKPEKVLSAVNALFREKSKMPANPRKMNLNVSRKSRVKVLHRSGISQVHMAIGALIGSGTERSTKAITLFQSMIDASERMSMPLNQELREKRGLAYNIWADVVSWSDVGNFYIYAAVNPEKWREAFNIILDVIDKGRTKGKLLEKAKKILVVETILNNEKPSEIIENAADDLALYGHPRLVGDIIKEIEDIDITEITEAVEQYLKPENLIKVFIAPKGVDIRI